MTSPSKPIDLRSDTVTRPSAAMRKAMAEAEVGDDVYGEDPTVRALEEKTAARLGLEAGLFVTSGMLGNQVSIGVHCRPGDELLADAGSHCLYYESGAVAALWGVQPQPIPTETGVLTVKDLSQALRPENIHFPPTRLLALENTHNRGGGVVWPREAFERVVREARRLGIKVHLDGARLFNAEVASRVPAGKLASLTDSTTVCFSKGLGAPVGSVVCGSRDFVTEARRLRKRLGGGMRQAGILAAAALYALEHNVERLAEDHANARRLAEALNAMPGMHVDLPRVQTNLVYAEVPGSATDFVDRLRARGVLINAGGPTARSVRFVTHLDVSAADIDLTLRAVEEVLKGA